MLQSSIFFKCFCIILLMISRETILEFNCNYIEGLKQPAMGKHWVAFGEGMAKTFEAYFTAK